jgi:DNA-binding HxlR family transcriptional regulator
LGRKSKELLQVDAPCNEDPKTEELVRELLVRMADKWSLLTIEILADGELRFSQLRERLNGISQKMLTQTLRQLERDGMVTRHVHAVVPPRVDYRLTPLGRSFGEAVCGIWIWASRHMPDVEQARECFDQQTRTAVRLP